MVSLSLVPIILSFTLLPFFFFFFFFFLPQQIIKIILKPKLPPGPRGLPVIGNLHQLNNSSLHLHFTNLSRKYGPLFSLKLGHRTVLVVSSPKMAKETLKDRDVLFSDRPYFLSQQKLSYNGIEIIFSPHGDYWKEIRKICVIHIFSAKRVSSFSYIREDEVHRMIRKISGYADSCKVINLDEVLISLASTTICRVAFGRSYEEEGVENSRFYGMMTEFQELMGTFFMSDYIHFTGWIDSLKGLTGRLERNFKDLDAFYQQVIDEHLDPQRPKPQEEDIVDVFLRLKNQPWFSINLTFDHLKALLMDFLAGGTDTVAAISVWAMSQLMKNPRVMQKVQEEVRNLYGHDHQKGFIQESDVKKLTFLKAVVKETLRLHPPAPLLAPRETTKSCIIQGFEIPAKTTVYVNAWAIHRDPEAWDDPEVFYPERFLNNAIDFKGQDMELIPFGAGRRMCPGLMMGIATVELVLANLVSSFDWEMPAGTKREDIDFEVVTGLVTHKKNHLWLVAKNPICKALKASCVQWSHRYLQAATQSSSKSHNLEALAEKDRNLLVVIPPDMPPHDAYYFLLFSGYSNLLLQLSIALIGFLKGNRGL
ncbi:cytochrome P450 71A1-like [Prosopis cineraria]|uniref:cytochrome P450 71A1-like n=1 Tax=Prosopis cineraria TaxID=364024 RepID=UPI0024102517|nr:cytochrome P450 71A1-like [Prosopis cineraria]